MVDVREWGKGNWDSNGLQDNSNVLEKTWVMIN